MGASSFRVLCEGWDARKPRPSLFLIPGQGGYAPNGNLLNVVDSVMGQWNYGYDDLNRLSVGSATTSPTAGVSNAYAGIGAAWAYDNLGPAAHPLLKKRRRFPQSWGSTNHNRSLSVPDT